MNKPAFINPNFDVLEPSDGNESQDDPLGDLFIDDLMKDLVDENEEAIEIDETVTLTANDRFRLARLDRLMAIESTGPAEVESPDSIGVVVDIAVKSSTVQKDPNQLSRSVATILQFVRPTTGASQERPDEPSSLERLLDWCAERRPSYSASWTWAGIVISTALSVTIVFRLWPLASVLLIARIVGSLLIGGGPSAVRPPLDRVAARSTVKTFTSPVRAVVGCLSSHLCDALVVVGMGFAVARSNGVLGTLTMTMAILMIAGTLARVGPAQVGVVRNRSANERVFRLGGFLAGLLGASISARWSAYLIFLGAVPAGIYGVWETIKTFRKFDRISIHSLLIFGLDKQGNEIGRAHV